MTPHLLCITESGGFDLWSLARAFKKRASKSVNVKNKTFRFSSCQKKCENIFIFERVSVETTFFVKRP